MLTPFLIGNFCIKICMYQIKGSVYTPGYQRRAILQIAVTQFHVNWGKNLKRQELTISRRVQFFRHWAKLADHYLCCKTQ